MTETETISIPLPRAARTRLDTLAAAVGRSSEELAQQAIESYLDLDPSQVEGIRQAVDKADAGGSFYSNSDVLTYLEARARGERPARPKPITSS